MANEIVQIDTNPINWTTFDKTTVIPDGYLLWFYNHPDSSSPVQMIGDGSSQASQLTPLTTSGAKYLTPGRKFAEEVVNLSDLPSNGWYKVGRSSFAGSYHQCQADFYASYGLNISACKAGVYSGGSAPNSDDLVCDLIKTPNMASSVSAVQAWRIGYDSTDQTQGFILEAFFEVGTGINTQIAMVNNVGRNIGASMDGWELLTPTALSDNILPGGGTANAYIEAGAEYQLDATGVTVEVPDIRCSKNDNDQIRVVLSMKKTIKQDFNDVVLTLPSVGLFIFDGNGISRDLVGFSYTIGGETTIGENLVVFYLNGTDIAVNLNNGPLGFRVSGSGFKIQLQAV